MPGKKSAQGAKRKTHHRTKGTKKQGVTPQPERVKREAAPPKSERHNKDNYFPSAKA